MDKLLLKVHSEHMQNNPLEDALADRFDLSEKNQGQFYSNSQILGMIDFSKSPANSKRAGDFLRSHGFKDGRRNHGRGFVLTSVSEPVGERAALHKDNVHPILPKIEGDRAMVAR